MLALPGVRLVPAVHELSVLSMAGHCLSWMSPCDCSSLWPSLPAPLHASSPLLLSLLRGTTAVGEAQEVMKMLFVTFMFLDVGLEVNYCYHTDRQCVKGWWEGRGHMGSPSGTAVWGPFPATNRRAYLFSVITGYPWKTIMLVLKIPFITTKHEMATITYFACHKKLFTSIYQGL